MAHINYNLVECKIYINLFKPINFQNHEKQNKTKQAKYIALSCMLAATTFFTACKKEAQLNSTPVTVEKTINTPSINLKSLSDNGIHVEFANGRLVFPTIEDYKKVANEQNEELSQQFLTEIKSIPGFKSLQNSAVNFGNYEIKSDFLSSILNENFIVQIQDYIIRLDANKQAIYLLETSLEHEYYKDLIAENPPQNTIIKLDFNDDVVDIMQVWGLRIRCCRFGGGGSGGGGPVDNCPESGIGPQNSGTFYNNILFTAEYKKYGILTELFAMASPVGSSGWSYSFDFTGGISSNSGYVHYKPRCISSTSYSLETQGTWKATYRIYQPYKSTEALNELYFGYYIKQNGVRIPNLPIVLIRQNK